METSVVTETDPDALEAMYADKEHIKNPDFVGYVAKKDVVPYMPAVVLYNKKDFMDYCRKRLNEGKDMLHVREEKEKKKQRKSHNSQERNLRSLSMDEMMKIALEESLKEAEKQKEVKEFHRSKSSNNTDMQDDISQNIPGLKDDQVRSHPNDVVNEKRMEFDDNTPIEPEPSPKNIISSSQKRKITAGNDSKNQLRRMTERQLVSIIS